MPAAPRRCARLHLHASQRLKALTVAVQRHGRALMCAAALTMIAALSSFAAVLLWHATVDQRVELGRGGAGVGEAFSLEKAAPERRDASVGTVTRDKRNAWSTARVAPREDRSASQRGDSTAIPGPALAVGTAGSALLLGAVAGVAVFRRYRAFEPDCGNGKAAGCGPTAEDVVDDLADDDPAENDLAQEDLAQEDLAEQDPLAGSAAAAGRAPDDSSARLGAPTAAVVRSTAVATARAYDAYAGLSFERPPVARDGTEPGQGTGFTLAGSNPVAATTGPPDRRMQSVQRVYERRKSGRIAFECAAVLQWRAGSSDVSVLDLSEMGLRCRLPANLMPSAAPKPPQAVVFSFPIEGTTVDGAARIAWRRTTPDGVELGLEFTTVSDQARTVLRATCSAGETATAASP